MAQNSGILDAARFPVVTVLPVMGDDRDDQEDDDRAGGEARKEIPAASSKPQTNSRMPTTEAPQQAVLEADALEEARRALDIAEQYLLACEMPVSHQR